LQDNLRQLASIDGIGQARFIAQYPLGIKDSVMARLVHLAPSGNARIYKNHLLSEDGRHLLITACPTGSGTDSRFARQATRLFTSVQNNIRERATAPISFTPVTRQRQSRSKYLTRNIFLKNWAVFCQPHSVKWW